MKVYQNNKKFTFSKSTIRTNPANIHLFQVNNRNTKKRCEICSQLTIKYQNDVIDVVLVFLYLTLNIFLTLFYIFSVADFEQVNVS